MRDVDVKICGVDLFKKMVDLGGAWEVSEIPCHVEVVLAESRPQSREKVATMTIRSQGVIQDC